MWIIHLDPPEAPYEEVKLIIQIKLNYRNESETRRSLYYKLAIIDILNLV